MNQYDRMANKLCRAHFNNIKAVVSEMRGANSIYSKIPLNIVRNGKRLGEMILVIEKDPFFKQIHVGGGFVKDKNGSSVIYIIIKLNSKPFKWSDLHLQIASSMRHELEHFRQYHTGIMSENPSGMGEILEPEVARDYLFHVDEVAAYSREILYRMRKVNGNYLELLVFTLSQCFAKDLIPKKNKTEATEKRKKWIKLFEDVQRFYYNYSVKHFSHLTASQLGKPQTNHLID